MKVLLALVLPGLLFVAIACLTSCSKTGTVLLNGLAKTGDYKAVTNIAYDNIGANKLDIYLPINRESDKGSGAAKKPVLIFFYGGCWGECSSLHKSDYLFVAQSFASRGIVTVIADFRQYPDAMFPEIMQDTANVVEWVSKHIGDYGGDTQRIFLSGHSSGAHIAAMLALNTPYLAARTRAKISGFIGLAGPYDFLPFGEAYQERLFAPLAKPEDSQPIYFVTANSPRLMILQGLNDTTVGVHNARNLAAKAASIGVESRVTLYPQLDHVGILTAISRPLQGRSTVLQDILAFIRL